MATKSPDPAAAPVIVWFRHDLRLTDHPALTAAVASGRPVIPVYVSDAAAGGRWAMGGASRWWLHHALVSLGRDLVKSGVHLTLRRGATANALNALARATGATTVHCTRAYEPWAIELETDVRSSLAANGVDLKRYPGALLYEPDAIKTKIGEPYKVYTPFWRAATQIAPRTPLPRPRRIVGLGERLASDDLASWGLLPTKPDWAGGLRTAWSPGPGEAGARQRLDRFLAVALKRYAEDRNRPDIAATSRLSPHLHFGEISPATCWHAAVGVAMGEPALERGLEVFCKELVWREFSYHLLFHWPTLPETPFRADFATFPWANDDAALRAWQYGRTGYPIVDAGMRELRATGWMHNRVRMIVASFLVKDLLIPWQAGEAWFWDCLVDADLASNAASWQWVAGSGADAAPYFRIFNPVKQGQTFDPDGAYIRNWVPELAHLPALEIHLPRDAKVLLSASNRAAYPLPIVDHAVARDRALAAYAAIKR